MEPALSGKYAVYTRATCSEVAQVVKNPGAGPRTRPVTLGKEDAASAKQIPGLELAFSLGISPRRLGTSSVKDYVSEQVFALLQSLFKERCHVWKTEEKAYPPRSRGDCRRWLVPPYGAGKNKLPLPLGDVPVLAHTLAAFENAPMCAISCWCAASRISSLYRACADVRHLQLRTVTRGGGGRTSPSCRRQRRAGGYAALVAVHDGARPLVSEAVISEAVYAAAVQRRGRAGRSGQATASSASRTASSRPTCCATPLRPCRHRRYSRARCFLRALNEVARQGQVYTDDCAAVEALGQPVYATHGSYENIKITTPEDIAVAEALLQKEGNLNMRIGTVTTYTGWNRAQVHHRRRGYPAQDGTRCISGCGCPHPRGDGRAARRSRSAISAGIFRYRMALRGRGQPALLQGQVAALLRSAAGSWATRRDCTAEPRGSRRRTSHRCVKTRPRPLAANGPISVKATTEEGLGFTGTEQASPRTVYAC